MVGTLPLTSALKGFGGLGGLGSLGGLGGLGSLGGLGVGGGTPVGISPSGVGGGLVEEETSIGFFEKIPLPLLLLLIPALATVVVVVVVVVVRTLFFIFILPNKKQEETTEAPYPYEEQPYYPGDNNYYPARKRRAAAAAAPSLTTGQVQKLTSVVFSALKSQECIQRLLCEVGKLSRDFPSASKMVKSVEKLVPDSLQNSFLIFAKEHDCMKFTCGDLPFKK